MFYQRKLLLFCDVFKSELVIVEKSLYRHWKINVLRLPERNKTLKQREKKKNVIKTISNTHSGIHTCCFELFYTKKTYQGGTEKFIGDSCLFHGRLLQDNSGSISGGICQREALCSGDDAFFQTILMIGTAHLVRGSKWYREEITLSERAYIIAGDDLFIRGSRYNKRRRR